MEKLYVDLSVEELSDEAIDYFKRFEKKYFAGSDIASRLQQKTIFKGKKLPDDFHEIRQATKKTRRLVVIHHDGRELPTMYGVPYVPTRSTLRDLATSLADVVGLEENERFVFGWSGFANFPAYLTGFLSEMTFVPERDQYHNVLTAWRVPKSDAYVTIDCSLGVNVGPLTSTLVFPVSWKETYDQTVLKKAIAPFLQDQELLETVLVDAFMYNSPNPQSHPQYHIDRVGIVLDEHVRDAGIQQYINGGRYHESATPRRLLDEWRSQGAYELQQESIHTAAPDVVYDALEQPLYQRSYEYRLECIDSKTLRLHIKTEREYIPISPCLQHPHAERWKTAMCISLHAPNCRPHTAFMMDIVCMDDTVPCAPQPRHIRTQLKHHQLQNLHRMLENESRDFMSQLYIAYEDIGTYYNPRNERVLTHNILPSCGGFLSDDVGLGKTLSILALCVSNPPKEDEDRPKATLIVCPATIIGQWAREIEENLPQSTKVVSFYSKSKNSVNIDRMNVEYDFVLTTYTTYLQNFERVRGIEWHRVVFDESHTMSERFSAMAPISPRRWCVSATPFHNLYRQFKALGLPRSYEVTIPVMYYMLRPLMLRHSRKQTECDVPPLPELREEMVPIHFETDEEFSLYAHAYKYIMDDLRTTNTRFRAFRINSHLQTLRSICIGGEWSLRKLFSEQLVLQQPDPNLVAPHDDDDMCPICMNVYDQPAITTCNHWFCSDCIATALARTGSKCPMCRTPQDQRQLRYGVVWNQELPDTPFGDESCVQCHSKLKKLLEILSRMRSEDATSKALVFVESSYYIPIIGTMLKQHRIKYKTVHGAMNAVSRGNAISAFQNKTDIPVLILSMRSAAAGLNLTAANHVIFMGPPSNTTSEQQAIGRAHRFGQLRPVTVYKLFMEGTIEESLFHLMQKTDRWNVDMLERVLGI